MVKTKPTLHKTGPALPLMMMFRYVNDDGLNIQQNYVGRYARDIQHYASDVNRSHFLRKTCTEQTTRVWPQ